MSNNRRWVWPIRRLIGRRRRRSFTGIMVQPVPRFSGRRSVTGRLLLLVFMKMKMVLRPVGWCGVPLNPMRPLFRKFVLGQRKNPADIELLGDLFLPLSILTLQRLNRQNLFVSSPSLIRLSFQPLLTFRFVLVTLFLILTSRLITLTFVVPKILIWRPGYFRPRRLTSRWRVVTVTTLNRRQVRVMVVR